MTDGDDAYLARRTRHDWITARKADYLQNERIDDELAERLATEDWNNGPGRPLTEQEQAQLRRARAGDISGLRARDDNGDWTTQ